MASATGSRRKARAAADKAAKERRQMILVGVLGVILLVVVLVELPKLFKSSGGSTTSGSAVGAPTVSVPGSSAAAGKALRAAMRQSPRDVFSAKTGGGEASTLGSVATPPGLHDPFAANGSSGADVAPVAPAPPPPKIPALPGKIVIGTPGPNKVAETGWIVILASIPTDLGKASATSFAAQANKAGIGSTSILNSSNRKPLRGGYWVVYTGPYDTLTQVSSAADNVHKSGFTSAYIRELIVYKLKPATTKKKTTKKK